MGFGYVGYGFQVLLTQRARVSPPEINISGTSSTGIFLDSDIDMESKYLTDLLSDEGSVSGSSSLSKGKVLDTQPETIYTGKRR